MDLRSFYQSENEPILDSYEKSLEMIREIREKSQSKQADNEKGEFYKLFTVIGETILKCAAYEKKISENYFKEKSFEDLLAENHDLYRDILPENYKTCYGNPAYSVSRFGQYMGQLMAYFYSKYREYIQYAFHHKVYKMKEYNLLFIDVFDYIETTQDTHPDYPRLKQLITSLETKKLSRDSLYNFKEKYDPDFTSQYYTAVMTQSDLKDLRYLFKYGVYIADNEIKIARFFINYPEEKAAKLAKVIIDGYLLGFVRDNKVPIEKSGRSNVNVAFPIGHEAVMRHLILLLQEKGLRPIFESFFSTKPNKQYEYDHKFDNALYFNVFYVNDKVTEYKKALEQCADFLKKLSGSIQSRIFGESPFIPESKKENLKLSDDQGTLTQTMRRNLFAAASQYADPNESSYAIIASPIPEIGENFEEIFEAIAEINMLDNDVYESVQQVIINTLDKADYVHVKGRGTNRTDIRVKMQKLNNPEKETNFYNCVADVNIPVGEIFTTPKFEGTEGILHCEEVYLRNFNYIDLTLVFKDGYITEYSCRNFENEADNKKFIEENLLFPHKTLPIGEFAIGTNTTAYVAARKYGIVNILPILIVEKMGPHFAIGDSCYTRIEDLPVYTPLNGKEITARDNEKSILRKTNPKEAYFNVHTDITLPYDTLGSISAVMAEGTAVDIIREGRFVLEGTEILNKPFEE